MRPQTFARLTRFSTTGRANGETEASASETAETDQGLSRLRLASRGEPEARDVLMHRCDLCWPIPVDVFDTRPRDESLEAYAGCWMARAYEPDVTQRDGGLMLPALMVSAWIAEHPNGTILSDRQKPQPSTITESMDRPDGPCELPTPFIQRPSTPDPPSSAQLAERFPVLRHYFRNLFR